MALRRRNALAMHDMHFGPSMTPMVDVVLVILIFFMTAAALVGPERLLKMLLPDRSEAAADPFALPPADLRLELSVKGGRVVADGLGLSAAPVETLPDALSDLAGRLGPENISIVLATADDVPYAALVAARDACAAAGIARVALE